MSSDVRITGRIMAAGRALAGVGREDFARIAGLPAEKVALIEAGYKTETMRKRSRAHWSISASSSSLRMTIWARASG
jgi:hypothetical protein